VLLLPLLVACGGEADIATAPPSPLDVTWVAALVRAPERFEALMGPADGPDRAGWIALHKNAWVNAAATPGAPGKRAAAELAVLHGVLADVSNDAWRSLGTTWELRGTFPTDSVLPALVALAAKDAGDNVSWARWTKVAARQDPLVTARVTQHDGLRTAPTASETIVTAQSLASVPLLEEPVGDSRRTLWDPMIHLTIAQAYGQMLTTGYPTDALATSVFSGRVAPEDGSPRASLAALGLTMPTEDDTEACREVVRAFDRQLDPWKVQLVATAPEAGQALLSDLRLVEGLRSRALVDWGVDALGAGRPRCALAFTEMALDHEHPREITPLNPPTLFAVSAAANLRTGRTREALDALEVLVGAYPEIKGLDETVGDLAVLQGLDRAGDSREN